LTPWTGRYQEKTIPDGFEKELRGFDAVDRQVSGKADPV
jgi:hypothetical protein